MSEYFPTPYENFDGDISVKLDLYNYATKTDLTEAAEVDMPNLATSLKAEVDKVDVDKLKTVPVNLSKQNDVVKNIDFVIKKLCMMS